MLVLSLYWVVTGHFRSSSSFKFDICWQRALADLFMRTGDKRLKKDESLHF